MPYYDYQCNDCNTTSELKLSLLEKESGLAASCPNCESTNMEQVFKAIPQVGKSSGTGSMDCPEMPGISCPSAGGGGCGCAV